MGSGIRFFTVRGSKACAFARVPNAMYERLMGGLTGRLPFNEGINNVPHRDNIARAWGIPPARLAETAKRKNKGYAIGMMERAVKGDLTMIKFSYATHIDMPEVARCRQAGLDRHRDHGRQTRPHGARHRAEPRLARDQRTGQGNRPGLSQYRLRFCCSRPISSAPTCW